MDFNYLTGHESIRFHTDMDSHICYSENSITALLFPEIGHITVKIEPAPIPDLTGYSPLDQPGVRGYYKTEENKEYSLFEEIYVVGKHEQKIILTITILDYTTKTTRAKTVDDLLSNGPIMKFLTSVIVIGGEPEPPRKTTEFILR